MIILDFVRPYVQINGKTITSKYLARQIPPEIHNKERECMLNRNMKNFCALYNLTSHDYSYHPTICCTAWGDGINCMLDPTCSKGEFYTKAEELSILFHMENSKFPEVAILVNVHRSLLANYPTYTQHRQMQSVIMATLSLEIEKIYNAYMQNQIRI